MQLIKYFKSLIFYSVYSQPVCFSFPQASLSHLSQLSHLSLSTSGLSSLPSSLLSYLDLSTLDLSHNPLLCDCHLSFLLEMLRVKPGLQLLGTCQEPQELHGQELRSLIRRQEVSVTVSCHITKHLSLSEGA